MPFEKGHPPYPRKTRLQVAEEIAVLEADPDWQVATAKNPFHEGVPASPIRRWSKLDDWLLGRLNDRWNFPEATWRGKLAGFAASNDYLFVENDNGVLLLEMKRHAMTGRPEVLEVFAWSRGSHIDKVRGSNWTIPQRSEHETELLRLYRHGREWARSMKAVRVEMGRCSDFAPSLLKHEFDGDYLVDVLL